jgi:N-acetylneuraminic acid mutarotase
VIVALSSAISLPNHPPKLSAPHNNTTFGVKAQESAASVAASAISRNRTLTFADRVAYQRAIEEVYWQHRIWPAANAGPKPPLDKVMSQAQIEKKVEDYLRNSQALEDYWQRPITPEQLQAEMERMARNTKQPEVLRELFEALGNDPFVIAECLARAVLTERLVADLSDHDKDQRFALLRTQSASSRFSITALGTAAYVLPDISSPETCTDNTWRATPLSPTGRDYHTAVWTGTEMIVWGGLNVTGELNTGGRYNPSTDSWTATSTANAPMPRWGHTALWTGTEMIVWGGTRVAGGSFNTGGRYNPSTDTWTATSTTNAPSARYGHTAVWTGGEMIVWGNSVALDDTGGKYNPNTNSWTATSTTNAPSSRFSHTAVWSGSEMIVWGGSDGSIFTPDPVTGGRYNPSTDSWTATSTSNVPHARWAHTALWTGTEMIVWGGFNDDPPFITIFNNGGKYNPSTNSWTATSINNVPEARYSHSAVWTGSEMIIWGGGGVYDSLNTGGKYNPVTNNWASTSTTNAPSSRDSHTAVWSGSEMIVWGGCNRDLNNNCVASNTGGRYCGQPSLSSPTPTPTPPAATPTPTSTPTASPTPTATPTPTPTPTPCSGRCAPTPRPRPTSPPRP